MRASRRLFPVSLIIAGLGLLSTVQLVAQVPDDPFIWLEEVEGERALEWVEARNAETMETLGSSARFETVYDQTLAILTSTDRIHTVDPRGNDL